MAALVVGPNLLPDILNVQLPCASRQGRACLSVQDTLIDKRRSELVDVCTYLVIVGHAVCLGTARRIVSSCLRGRLHPILLCNVPLIKKII